MVAYATHYRLYDKDMKLIRERLGTACFSGIMGKNAFTEEEIFFEYDFCNYDKSLSIEDMHKYFLFLKNIPEFTDLMPYDTYQMAKDKKIVFDLTKVNGIKIFAMVTAVRAVREDPTIVKQVLAFDPTKEYSITKLGILKAVGAVHHHNAGHWLTGPISIKHLNKSPSTKAAWKSTTPAKETGFIRGVHETFQSAGDGWATTDPVNPKYIETVLNEHRVKVEEKPKPKKKASLKTKTLILDF